MTNAKYIRLIGRGFIVWLVIIAAEFLHGTARILLLEPMIGDFRARQISVFTAILIIFAISYAFVGWLRAAGNLQLFLIGLMWLALTIAFEIVLGRLMNLSWERILSDYDIANGGLMPLGLLFLTFAPIIAARLKNAGVRFSPLQHFGDDL